MSVKITKTSPLSKVDIDRFISELGNKLPSSYEKFILLYNGAKPATNIFKVNKDIKCGVNQFIPVSKIKNEIKYIDSVSSTKIPIAWAEGGNYILLDSNTGKIYFWDHEAPETQHELSQDINGFIKQLEPFDVSTIELKEGQVKSAWIDPEFLKNL